MSNTCPDNIMPDGPVCPRCGKARGPSGIDGGSWVHIRKEPVVTRVSGGSPQSRRAATRTHRHRKSESALSLQRHRIQLGEQSEVKKVRTLKRMINEHDPTDEFSMDRSSQFDEYRAHAEMLEDSELLDAIDELREFDVDSLEYEAYVAEAEGRGLLGVNDGYDGYDSFDEQSEVKNMSRGQLRETIDKMLRESVITEHDDVSIRMQELLYIVEMYLDDADLLFMGNHDLDDAIADLHRIAERLGYTK